MEKSSNSIIPSSLCQQAVVPGEELPRAMWMVWLLEKRPKIAAPLLLVSVKVTEMG